MSEEVYTGAHFVLVHGVGHGAWCWYKLRCLLENSGHKVTCLDLSSAGIDKSDPNSILSFEEYDKPLSDFLLSLPDSEKVVLVGHSAGGLSVTHAIHEFGDKIAVAVYVGATMLRSGFCSEEAIKAGIPDTSEYGDIHEFKFGLGFDHPPTSVIVRKEFQRETMYHLSPKEDSTLASMLLRPGPTLALRMARFDDDGMNKNVDNVRRVYVKTMQDRTLKPEQQEGMVRRWPPSEVLSLESDHSPFFSVPTELSNLLLKSCIPLLKKL